MQANFQFPGLYLQHLDSLQFCFPSSWNFHYFVVDNKSLIQNLISTCQHKILKTPDLHRKVDPAWEQKIKMTNPTLHRFIFAMNDLNEQEVDLAANFINSLAPLYLGPLDAGKVCIMLLWYMGYVYAQFVPN